MKRKPTLNDIAAQANVSIATVSRVINQNGYVSNENRSKIEAAIAELDYKGRSGNKTVKKKKANALPL